MVKDYFDRTTVEQSIIEDVFRGVDGFTTLHTPEYDRADFLVALSDSSHFIVEVKGRIGKYDISLFKFMAPFFDKSKVDNLVSKGAETGARGLFIFRTSDRWLIGLDATAIPLRGELGTMTRRAPRNGVPAKDRSDAGYYVDLSQCFVRPPEALTERYEADEDKWLGWITEK